MSSISTNIDNISNNPCSICLLELKKNIKTLKCKHDFHKKCINEWIINNNVCPLCRSIIPISKPATLPTNTIIPVNASHSIIITNNNNNNNHHNILLMIKKIVIILLYFLSLVFFISSSLYNDASIFKANKYINNIISHMNSTELNGKNNNTYSGEVLIICDIIFFAFYIIMNSIIIFVKLNSNTFKYVFLCILCITIGIIRAEFYKNTNEYLNDKELNINNENYNYHMQSSIMYYGISFGSQVFLSMILYMNRINN
jgi:hypothetical protein